MEKNMTNINHIICQLFEHISEYDLIDSFKLQYKIPVYTNNITFKSGVIPHSQSKPPKIILNYRWQYSKNPEKSLLMLYIHEQLHIYDDKVSKKSDYDYLDKIYGHLYDQFHDDFKNKISYLTHIIVIVNEINLAKKLLTKKEINAVYFDQKHFRPYRKYEYYVFNNFKQLYNTLKQLNLIW